MNMKDIPEWEGIGRLGITERQFYAMQILDVAKTRTSDDELGKRYDKAIQAIGLHILKEVEGGYKNLKKFRVSIKQTKVMEVEAASVSDANKKAMDNITQFETVERVAPAVESVKEL